MYKKIIITLLLANFTSIAHAAEFDKVELIDHYRLKTEIQKRLNHQIPKIPDPILTEEEKANIRDSQEALNNSYNQAANLCLKRHYKGGYFDVDSPPIGISIKSYRDGLNAMRNDLHSNSLTSACVSSEVNATRAKLGFRDPDGIWKNTRIKNQERSKIIARKTQEIANKAIESYKKQHPQSFLINARTSQIAVSNSGNPTDATNEIIQRMKEMTFE